jgi:hypothetical protein
MNKVLKSGLALILTVMAGVAMSDSSTSRISNSPTSGQEAALYACGVLKQDCSGLDHWPQIIITDLSSGNYGEYSWSYPDVIFIDDSFTDPVLVESIIRHEATHWVDNHLGLTGMDACLTEALAWYVSNMYSIENGAEPRWDWWLSYNCNPMLVVVSKE